MASHEYLRFILKTPKGYLTPTGTVDDICDDDIIVFNIYQIGGLFSSKEEMVQNFLEESTLDFSVDECTVLYYSCRIGGYYNCTDCPYYAFCDFWHNRNKVEFIKDS